jgi:epidermal growth factor receptor substrate 15
LRAGSLLSISITTILLLATSSTLVYSTQTTEAPQNDLNQLETLVQVASASRSYALSVVSFARLEGQNVSSAESLLASGNATLTIAVDDMYSDSNLSQGIKFALLSMNDYTNASTEASALVASSSDLNLNSVMDSIVDSNNTANKIESVLTGACAFSPPNSNYALQFGQNCLNGKSYTSAALSTLKQASSILANDSSSITSAIKLIEDAKGNLSQADQMVLQLSTYGYSSRVQAFLSGPFSQLVDSANDTVKAQTALVSVFNGSVYSYAQYYSQQASGESALKSEAYSISSSISNTSTAILAVNSGATSEQTTLATISADMDNLSALLVGIPPLLIAQVTSDVSNVQTAVSTVQSSVNTLESEAISFNSVGATSISTYSSTFQADASAVETDDSNLLASLQNLLVDLSGASTLFPALMSSVSVISAVITTLASNNDSISTSVQSAATSLSISAGGFSSYQADLQAGSTAIKVNDQLISNMSAISSSEKLYLNATGLATLQSALTSLQDLTRSASSFVSLAGSLQTSNVSQVNSIASSLASSGISLETQASSTANALNSASAFLSSDLNTRSQAFSAGNALVSQAMVVFGNLNISQGSSLLTNAKFEFKIASKPG